MGFEKKSINWNQIECLHLDNFSLFDVLIYVFQIVSINSKSIAMYHLTSFHVHLSFKPHFIGGGLSINKNIIINVIAIISTGDWVHVFN